MYVHSTFVPLDTSTVTQLEQDFAYFTDEQVHLDYIYIYIYIQHLRATGHVCSRPTGALLHRGAGADKQIE